MSILTLSGFHYRLFFSNGALFFSSSLLVPIYAIFAEEMGASVVQVSLLAATAALSRGIALLTIRYFNHTDGRSALLFQCGALLYTATWFSLIFAHSVYHLFFIQIILGTSMALVAPAFRTLLANSLQSGKEISIYSNWEMFKAFLGASAALAGGLLVNHYGFITLFIIMTLLCVVGFTTYVFKNRICT